MNNITRTLGITFVVGILFAIGGRLTKDYYSSGFQEGLTQCRMEQINPYDCMNLASFDVGIQNQSYTCKQFYTDCYLGNQLAIRLSKNKIERFNTSPDLIGNISYPTEVGK